MSGQDHTHLTGHIDASRSVPVSYDRGHVSPGTAGGPSSWYNTTDSICDHTYGLAPQSISHYGQQARYDPYFGAKDNIGNTEFQGHMRSTNGTSGQVRKESTNHPPTEINPMPQSPPTQMNTDSKKKRKLKPVDSTHEEDLRRKTARACDQCRTKKIRCEIIIQPDVEEAHPHGMCKHCQNSNTECTFYMPIAETRFKKRKATGTASPKGQEPSENTRQSTQTQKQSPVLRNANPGRRADDMTSHPVSAGGQTSPLNTDQVGAGQGILIPKAGMAGRPMVGGRIEGPTSLSYILHSTASLPRRSVEEYDIRNHQTWQFTSNDGDGVIRVCNPPSSSSFKQSHSQAEVSPADSGDHPLTRPVLTAALISTLVTSYFTHISPLFPIVCKSDFVSGGNPPPLLLYAMAGVAACRRGVQPEVFDAIRTVINGLIRNNDVLSDPTLTNIQALLVLCMAGDLHAQPTSTAISASVTRVSVAIRMAQNLGLHRESVVTSNDPKDLAKIELKRRIWAVCVIMDRWVAACLGIPMLIDITDCDCLLPSPYEIGSSPDGSATWKLEDLQPFGILTEHLKLSILLGRVLKCIYSPVGLTQTTNEQLGALITDMTEWQRQLPAHLQFEGSNSNMSAGLLHLGHVAMQFLFWRTFMRLNYSLPSHIQLSMDMPIWNRLMAISSSAILWLNKHEEAIDTIFIFAYAINNAALIQYHTWVRRMKPENLEMLRVLRDVVQRWEDAVQPDHMSMRRKTIEVMTLLYEAAKRAHTGDGIINTAALNPTTGLKRRDPALFQKIIWKPDPNDPGSGIFVADNSDEESKKLQQELPPGVLTTVTSSLPAVNAGDRPLYGDASLAGTIFQQLPLNMHYTAHGMNTDPSRPSGSQNFGARSSGDMQPVSYLNLNPELQNFQRAPENANQTDITMLPNFLDQEGTDALLQAQLLDNTLLNGLPPTFDFNAWGAYFDRFNLPAQASDNPGASDNNGFGFL